jgi:glycosyltransferase involved in cell wall biosynthesis
MHPETAIIIPVYNEEQVIEQTIADISQEFAKIICVNDGGKDGSSECIRKTDALLVEHPINMGQGAALQTGIEYALLQPDIKYLITFDADGQHSVADAVAMLKIIKKEELDIVVGSRFLGKAVNITMTKRMILKLAIMFTNLFSNVKLTDTHNGLRVFNRKFAQQLDISMPGMAHASEIIDKMGRGNWRYKEVPVTINYTDYSKAKGQSALNSVNILIDMLASKIK